MGRQRGQSAKHARNAQTDPFHGTEPSVNQPIVSTQRQKTKKSEDEHEQMGAYSFYTVGSKSMTHVDWSQKKQPKLHKCACKPVKNFLGHCSLF